MHNEREKEGARHWGGMNLSLEDDVIKAAQVKASFQKKGRRSKRGDESSGLIMCTICCLIIHKNERTERCATCASTAPLSKMS